MKVGGPRQGKVTPLILSEDTLHPPAFRGISTSSVMPPPGTSSLLMCHRQGVPARLPAMGEVNGAGCCVLLVQAGMSVPHIRQSRASSTKG